DNLYRFQAIHSKGRLIYTNTAPTECFRGFGDPEAAFAQEQLVDEIARLLKFDPATLRLRNCVSEGDTTVHGWRITSSGFDQCLAYVSEQVANDRAKTGTQPVDSRVKIGYGLAPGMHVTSNRGRIPKDSSRIKLSVKSDGSVCLLSSEVDVGGGTNRVLAEL